MQRKIIIEQTFGGDIENREHALAVFERHIEAVRRTIAAERLLVHEIAQGWQPLCDFLALPVPDEPFPQANAAQEFRARFEDTP
jgi:Sulfotransferase domain